MIRQPESGPFPSTDLFNYISHEIGVQCRKGLIIDSTCHLPFLFIEKKVHVTDKSLAEFLRHLRYPNRNLSVLQIAGSFFIGNVYCEALRSE